ncbi:hypothetical protein ACFYMO_28200 [Streptomyces sp. NPDC007025]|uniref:hypothetical protein n=1 Tax=Streptomyces sp. NPDC007025 TaxID=3364771 RepID=UPI0036C9C85D
MMDNTDAPAADTGPLSPCDEARIAHAGSLIRLARDLLDRVPVDPDAEPGALLAAALRAEKDAADLVAAAVVAERERGTSYDVLGRVAGMSRQSAHKKWAGAVAAWAANGRTCTTDPAGALDKAALYDQWYTELCPGGQEKAVTSGLDAVRIPGSQRLDRARRERAGSLRQSLDALREQGKIMSEEYNRLRQTDDLAGLEANLLATVDNDEKVARLYDQLVPLEPELADEHHADAERHRGYATNNRDYADVIARQLQQQG